MSLTIMSLEIDAETFLLHYYKYDIKMILFKNTLFTYEIVLEFMGHAAIQNPRTLSPISLSHPSPLSTPIESLPLYFSKMVRKQNI